MKFRDAVALGVVPALALVALLDWYLTDTRSDAVVVQLSATGEIAWCWRLDRCEVNVHESSVSWKCGKYGDLRHVSAPFRVVEDRYAYETVGLDVVTTNTRCVKEDGAR